MLNYVYEGDVKNITAADVIQFVHDFKANKLEPYYRSEPIPWIDNFYGLVPIVGRTWDKIVNDPEKDVFVFYF